MRHLPYAEHLDRPVRPLPARDARPHGRRRRGALAPILLGGAALAATALYNAARARQAERRNPPIGRFIEVDGVRLHYVERGSGDPVVLLHGNGTMVEDMMLSGLVEMLAEDYRVIVFDRPGYGHSERPRDRIWTHWAQAALLRKAFDRLGVERPLVLGHSWGSLVALALGLSYESRIRGLVLASGYYYPLPRLDILLFSPPGFPVVGDVLRYTISPILSRMILPLLFRRLFAPTPVTRRFDRLFPREMTVRPSQLRAAGAEAAMMLPAALGFLRRYGELRVPVPILTGGDDFYVGPDRHSERLRGALPDSEFVRVPGAGHMVHHVAPEAGADAIDRLGRRSR